jgi:predicted GNAT family N-acyltransferase
MEIKIMQLYSSDTRDKLYYSLCQLKYNILVTEQQKNVANGDHQQQVVIDELDQRAVIFAAVKDEKVIGSLRLNFPGDHPADYEALNSSYRLDLFETGCVLKDTFTITRFLVAQSYRNSRVAYQLAATATSYVCNTLHKTISIVGSTPAIFPFHKRLGYRRYTAEPILFPEGMQVYPMLLDLNDASLLQSVRSPLLSMLTKDRPIFPDITAFLKNLVALAPQVV